ncbi:MAG TPA: DUF362 domain-containing protein [Candidatus Brocadiia bacterium]|nr:DUF362 domain-containing protein [Candidatus Brocadiia bacterium]
MASEVFFASAEISRTRKDLLAQTRKLFDEAGGKDLFAKGDLTAIKLSFSEVGNTAYLRPPLVREVVRKVKARGAKPFLTDANTLYAGGRANAVDHLETAILNGFSYAVVEAPLIIADGLRGKSYVSVPIDGKRLKAARIGAEVAHADALISLAHAHGHLATGMAATFKNIGMGLGCRAGKQEMHSQKDPPKVDPEKCEGDAVCVRYCPVNAIRMSKGKAVIDGRKCIRCGECTVTCPRRAISIRWGDEPGALQERIVEYTAAALKGKKDKSLFFAYLLDVTPGCLCGVSDPPIIQDIGVLCSRDPVAIEQATFDLVRQGQGLASCDWGKGGPGEDKFRALYPEHDSELTMRYAEEMGLGTRKYTLTEV